ncbi:MAG: membrane protein insertase YidC [Acidobacteriota bacterium]|nr:membrane protein insertase YidC [Acidobacteriota bacterium]
MADNQNQSRFLLAIGVSLGILLLWTYFFPPPKPTPNANTETANVAQQSSAPTPAVSNQQQTPVQNQTPDNTPNRLLTVKTPLYEAKFDSRGAVVTSWILKQNKVGDDVRPLYSISSTPDNPQPLELISDEARTRRELPFELITGDAGLNQILSERNYQIVGAETDEIVLNGNESKQVQFVLHDAANGIEAVKTLILRADDYVSDFQTKLTRNGQAVPNTKLQIGARIGDQGIKHHDYYAIEPEAVAAVGGTIERQPPSYFADQNGGRLLVNGETSWAGVGDTYFAMAAIPQQPLSGLEFVTSKYEVAVEPYTSGIWGLITGQKVDREFRYLTSALVPINSDGTVTTKVYTGTKDHYLLSTTSERLSQTIGRAVDLDDFINWGWFSSLTRPIAIPILGVLRFLSNLTQNYGVAILLFTFLFFSILFPMRWYQSKSFKKAQKNAPKMKELQDRYKELQAKKVPLDDPRMRELQMEQLRLTKDAVPIGGCLPLLLQFPLLIALYIAITISLDFRLAPFLWLPDLSNADPYHALEFMFAGSMMLAMLYTPTTAAITPEQQMQQKMMTYLMPVMMLFVMWGAPSGLLVYWLAGNVIGFLQQLLINRMNKTDEPPGAQTTTGDLQRPMTKKERMKAGLSTS